MSVLIYTWAVLIYYFLLTILTVDHPDTCDIFFLKYTSI